MVEGSLPEDRDTPPVWTQDLRTALALNCRQRAEAVAKELRSMAATVERRTFEFDTATEPGQGGRIAATIVHAVTSGIPNLGLSALVDAGAEFDRDVPGVSRG